MSQYDYCKSCGRDADGKDGIQCKNCDRIDAEVAKRRNDPSLAEIHLRYEGGDKMEFIRKEDLDTINAKMNGGFYIVKGKDLPAGIESQFRKEVFGE